MGILNARNVVEALLDEVQNEESLLREFVSQICGLLLDRGIALVTAGLDNIACGSPRETASPQLNPTTIERGPIKGSTRVLENPTSRIHS